MGKIIHSTKHVRIRNLSEMIKKEPNSKLANRLNAIRLLMLGFQQQEVAKICGVDRRTILTWVKKWNQSGREGLISNSGGSVSKVSPNVRLDITEIIDIKKKINGRIVTGKLICGYIKNS